MKVIFYCNISFLMQFWGTCLKTHKSKDLCDWIGVIKIEDIKIYVTKPKPFEIILLQTTRKKNNWKTEETLERELLSLESERIKGCNPWCL